MSFDHLNTIYRSFDIRGKYPEEITEDEVKKIGQVLVQKYSLKRIAIGRDIRPSANSLFVALAEGITAQGADVIDLGLTTTPMTYFMAASDMIDATIMITASHMPSEYNGLKITTKDAIPLSAEVIQEIRTIVGEHTYSEVETHGQIESHAMQPAWIAHFKKQHNLTGAGLSIVIDPANMIGALEVATFRAFEPDLHVATIFDTFDHTCPNHEANPVKHETLVDLGEAVRCQMADIGIAFDGDADRVGFVDETGTPIPSDIIGILLARQVLERYPKTTVVYDIRSTRALPEFVEHHGGKALMNRVGHSFIKDTMRKNDAALGIELSGHFFFKDSLFAEGGPLPAFMILELMNTTGKKLSELVAEVTKYHHSGEINSEILRKPEEIYTELKHTFAEATFDTTDGLLIKTDTWWCNVRPSANDPVMRLNLEADTKELMDEKRDEVLEIIRG